MKAALALCLSLLTVTSAGATTWDESTNGELSGDPAHPTVFALTPNSANPIFGTLSPNDRDYITFTVPAGYVITPLNLGDLFLAGGSAYAALNIGSTSYIPGPSTNANFLSAIDVTTADVGKDLLYFFVNRSVIPNSLSTLYLGAGTYCFLIQKTDTFAQNYILAFYMLAGPVATESSTWGAIKALYR